MARPNQNIAVRMREHILHRRGASSARRMQRAHGEHLAVGNVLCSRKTAVVMTIAIMGNRRGHAVARTVSRKEFLVDDDRQGVVVFANEHRQCHSRQTCA